MYDLIIISKYIHDIDWKVTVLSYWDDSFSPKGPQSLVHVSQPTPRRIKREGVGVGGGERESSAIVQSSHFSLVCDSDDITIMHIRIWLCFNGCTHVHTHALTLCYWIDLVAVNLWRVPWTLDILLYPCIALTLVHWFVHACRQTVKAIWTHQ